MIEPEINAIVEKIVRQIYGHCVLKDDAIKIATKVSDVIKKE